MRSEARAWSARDGWGGRPLVDGASLVLVFGDRIVLSEGRALAELAALHPGAEIVGCSTAGEIHDTHLLEAGVVAIGLAFEHTQVRVFTTSSDDSARAGARLADALPREGLRHVLLFSEGSSVNGTELTRGLRGLRDLSDGLPANVSVTGGLAGDAARFERTFVVRGTELLDSSVVAVGLYGDRLRVGYGSMGGWDPFGPDRVITRSEGNTLYELDGEPALALYKQYLGPHADELPSSALLFPLLLTSASKTELVRTILGVDEARQSMQFAGDVPQGATVRLMKANFERIVDGAAGAAEASSLADGAPDVALLVSCVGRRLILKQRTEDELEAVRDAFGPSTVIAGFYSYGELCPTVTGASCELHNQTMTITTLAER